jgi:hypothetical protein
MDGFVGQIWDSKYFQTTFIFNLKFVFTLIFLKMAPFQLRLSPRFLREQDFTQSKLLQHGSWEAPLRAQFTKSYSEAAPVEYVIWRILLQKNSLSSEMGIFSEKIRFSSYGQLRWDCSPENPAPGRNPGYDKHGRTPFLKSSILSWSEN